MRKVGSCGGVRKREIGEERRLRRVEERKLIPSLSARTFEYKQVIDFRCTSRP